ncbi:MAG: 5'/3'-nucleotidase SurE [Leptospiraceae bacterium]|nr:5'/3'-nucleotidase SurE [Leptospiraceae bacterium]MDW7975673.1 5'/3'-nucleotidase SurE [Leptospiraceae bacterium]
MRILIVNDDGLHSNGMLHLEEELSKFYEVYSICPDRQRSATSQAITIRETLIVEKVSETHFKVNGYPTDCVNIGLYGNLIPPVDIVISGINHGPNLGDDIHYSGTVGAARHAVIHNKKAIAISYENFDFNGNFRRVARWLRIWLEENYQYLNPDVIYNINYPYEEEEDSLEKPFPEVVYTFQGSRIYKDSYEILEEEHQERWVMKLKETILAKEVLPGSDFEAIQNKKISITPLSLTTTHWEELNRWKNLQKQPQAKSL